MDDLLLGPLGPERDHPDSDLSFASRGGVARRSLAVAICIALAALSGCGDEGGTTSAAGLPAAGGGGAVVYAVPALPPSLDPLTAAGSSQELIARQVHEPLVGPLRGPYGSPRRRPGLALSAKPSPDRTVWTIALRHGVRFQDGTPFNASAVLANARRWLSTAQGRALLPDLFAVDAPRPNEVRFLLDSADSNLPRRLALPRLGIVSPQALAPRSGEGANFSGRGETGTGPFQLGRLAGGEVSLVRYAGWWGSALGLGPALEAVAFRRAPTDRERLSLLSSGAAQVADPLGPASLRVVEGDPLLRLIEAGGRGLGVEASVRGLTGEAQSLSSVWLTTVAD